jgi:IMP dehydrogenase/GMP reductase
VKTHFREEEDSMTPEEKASKIREIHSKSFMNYPTNSGISGAVFKSKKLYISNNASKETKFVEEIDNQSSCTDVQNFMIGPVFGKHNKEIPCAII